MDERPPRTLHLPREVLEAVLQHARDASPAECCGALVGVTGGDGAEIHLGMALRLPNQEASAARYRVAPESLQEAEREAARVGFEVVGFYHSHGGSPATPSATDLELAWPWYVYLIAGIGAGEPPVRAWRLAEDRSGFVEERLVIEGEAS